MYFSSVRDVHFLIEGTSICCNKENPYKGVLHPYSENGFRILRTKL
jgi:hypothetical protein